MSSTRATLARLAAGMGILAGALSAAGCSSGGTAASVTDLMPQSPPPVTSTPTILDPVGLTLPVEAYLYTARQSDELQAANNAFVTQCMRGFGFDYSAPQTSTAGGTQTSANTAHRYGVVDAQQVARLGYHPPIAADGGKPAAPALDATMQLVLTGGQGSITSIADLDRKSGSGQSYQGRPIPNHGCVGEAYRKLLANGGTPGDPDVSAEIDGQSLSRSISDPRVVAVFREWSGCMKSKGFSYGMPFDPVNDRRFNTPAPSADEIATAQADVSCKQRYNVVGVWFAVDSALQEQAIEHNAQQLSDVKTGMDQELRTAAAILGSPAGGN